MKTRDGDEMSLTPDAERVCADLVRLAAVPTSGHRTVAGQAHAMAVNVAVNRAWIGQTYRHGAELQKLVDAHPEWVTVRDIGEGLYLAMMHDGLLPAQLSHHLSLPCRCFDLSPESVTEAVRRRIEDYQREGVIAQVLWIEGGLKKCHIEVAALPVNKIMEV
jgi:hypothetical protein